MMVIANKIGEIGQSNVIIPKWWIECKLNNGDKIALLKEERITLVPERELLGCSFNPAKGGERQ